MMMDYKPADPKKTKFLTVVGSSKVGLSDHASKMFFKAGKDPERVQAACKDFSIQIRAFLSSPEFGEPKDRARKCVEGLFHKNFHEHQGLNKVLINAARLFEDNPDADVFSISFNNESDGLVWVPDISSAWRESARNP